MRDTGRMARTRQERLPSSPFVRFLRWWLGLIVCAVGLLIAILRGFDETGLEALFALWGAGLSIILMNVLWRVGVSGDTDRDDEHDAREEFERTGHWPDDPPAT